MSYRVGLFSVIESGVISGVKVFLYYLPNSPITNLSRLAHHGQQTLEGRPDHPACQGAPRKPYDGHTLKEVLEETETLGTYRSAENLVIRLIEISRERSGD